MRDRIAQPCHTFQAQRQPVAFHRDSIPAAYRTVAQRRFCVVSAVTLGGAIAPATGNSPPDGSGTGGTFEKDVALLIPSIEKLQRAPLQAEPALWSEDASYPQPRRVMHRYPHNDGNRRPSFSRKTP